MLFDKIKNWYRSVKAFFKRQVKKVLTLFIGTAMAASGGAIADEQINPYIDAGDFRELPVASEVRDSGEQRVRIAKDRPEATFEKWNGEAAMRVSVPSVQEQGSRSMFSDRLTYGTGDRQVEMRQVENGYKVDIILNSQPKENEFVLDIENVENLDFFYQPPLTEETEKGESCIETTCFKEVNGEMATTTYRPENVVGSYAVYHKTKRDHIEGQTNYATGKAYHIYRPLVIDDEGNEVWGELSYENGELTVTVPQSFLDKAVYPVVVDPTFGYDTAGGSNQTLAGNYVSLTFGESPSEDGTVTSISFYARNTNTGQNTNAKGAIYNIDNSLTGVGDEITISDDTAQWRTSNASINVFSSVSYRASAGFQADSDPEQVLVYYDDAVDGEESAIDQFTYPNFPDPTDGFFFERRRSIYATYTATAEEVTPQSEYFFQ